MVLELISGRYILSGIGKNVGSFLGLKLLDNGEFLLVEEDTSDIKKYNYGLEIEGICKGKKSIETGKIKNKSILTFYNILDRKELL